MLRYFYTSVAIAVILATSSLVSAQESDTGTEQPTAATPSSGSSSSSSKSSSSSSKSSTPKHETVLKEAKKYDGKLMTLYQKENKLYGEFSSSTYSHEYIVLISIARGIGSGSLLGGMSWGFGDDWIWKFRKIDDRVQIIRRNVRFKAKPGSREAFALENAYTDSILFSLPIITKGPGGGDLVDLTPVFMSDLPQISQVLSGFSFASDKSTWASIKNFDSNVELQVAATYSSSGRSEIESVADSRGVSVNVHYSISKLPESNGYTPRLADDRVGYFLTVLKDYSKQTDRDRFVRYINRWHLVKEDTSREISEPKERIVFWIEKTVPAEYRPAIQEGILEWNKAFEKAGIVNAIEVRLQPVDADWDPEDINYNTFRWITSSAGFAMGPSRVNPYTGQILDADIIFDADFLTFWKEEFETFTKESVAETLWGHSELLPTGEYDHPLVGHGHPFHQCQLGHGMSQQLAFGATAIFTESDPKIAEQKKEKLIMQGLKDVAMHEVGHTLGLRHNFKASTWRSLKEMNDSEKAKDGMVASVMDYNPVNIVPKGWKQGDYYPTTLGPYDYWAIEYGYKHLSGGTNGELEALQEIASRSGEPGLAYTTDEDTISSDPDPLSNRFDLGSDAMEYARTRAELTEELIPGLADRMTKEGDDYVQARRAFNIVMNQRGQAMYYAARHVGGLHTSRSHKGDKGAKPPIEVVDAKEQREALKMLEEQLFSDKPYDFPPDLYNQLGPSRWRHWGTSPTRRKDFPVHDFIAMWQELVLSHLLSSTTLERMYDAELKVPANKDAFTTAELIERLTESLFSEVDTVGKGDYTNRKPAISSLRRNLQRIYLQRLANLAMGRTSAPDDCQTVAYAELGSLDERISKLLAGNVKLDTYTRAHLLESSSRIKKVLDAGLTLSGP